jgi:hypothetical protein
MSKEAVEAIIGKAVVDGRFREALFTDPEEALAGYELTGEEVAALKAMDREGIESFAGALDERISKALAPFHAEGRGGHGLLRWLDPEAGRRVLPFDRV